MFSDKRVGENESVYLHSKPIIPFSFLVFTANATSKAELSILFLELPYSKKTSFTRNKIGIKIFQKI